MDIESAALGTDLRVMMRALDYMDPIHRSFVAERDRLRKATGWPKVSKAPRAAKRAALEDLATADAWVSYSKGFFSAMLRATANYRGKY